MDGLQDKLTQFINHPFDEFSDHMDEKRRTAARLSASGLSLDEIGTTMNISTSTVGGYIKDCLLILGLKHKRDLTKLLFASIKEILRNAE